MKQECVTGEGDLGVLDRRNSASKTDGSRKAKEE